jgi:hypothetical protein
MVLSDSDCGIQEQRKPGLIYNSYRDTILVRHPYSQNRN